VDHETPAFVGQKRNPQRRPRRLLEKRERHALLRRTASTTRAWCTHGAAKRVVNVDCGLNRLASRIGHLERRARRVACEDDDAGAIPGVPAAGGRITKCLGRVADDVYLVELPVGEECHETAVRRPCFRPFHFPFVGTRCFSSSNQLRTTTMLAGVAFGSPLSLTIRKRRASGDTSYVRPKWKAAAP